MSTIATIQTARGPLNVSVDTNGKVELDAKALEKMGCPDSLSRYFCDAVGAACKALVNAVPEGNNERFAPLREVAPFFKFSEVNPKDTSVRKTGDDAYHLEMKDFEGRVIELDVEKRAHRQKFDGEYSEAPYAIRYEFRDPHRPRDGVRGCFFESLNDSYRAQRLRIVAPLLFEAVEAWRPEMVHKPSFGKLKKATYEALAFRKSWEAIKNLR